MNDEKRPVLITTSWDGVFFGYLLKRDDEKARTLVLFDCRSAIYWAGSKGFLGLAATGPHANSRIGAASPRSIIHEVTSASDCSEAAEKAWKEWP